MIVAGRENKPLPPPIERIHRAYREWCVEFAESFGCEPDWLAHWFEQCALMRMHEQGMGKNLAAFMAKADCLALFAKVGSDPN